MNIVDIACQTANQNGSEKIKSIEIEVGALAGVMEDSLDFCFQAARMKTIAEQATLDITSIPGTGHCHTCDQTFETDSFFTLCPFCSGFAVDIIEGKELKIKYINVD